MPFDWHHKGFRCAYAMTAVTTALQKGRMERTTTMKIRDLKEKYDSISIFDYFPHLFEFCKCSSIVSWWSRKNCELHNNKNIYEKWSYNHLHDQWWRCEHTISRIIEKEVRKSNWNYIAAISVELFRLLTSYLKNQLKEGIFTFIWRNMRTSSDDKWSQFNIGQIIRNKTCYFKNRKWIMWQSHWLIERVIHNQHGKDLYNKGL